MAHVPGHPAHGMYRYTRLLETMAEEQRKAERLELARETGFWIKTELADAVAGNLQAQLRAELWNCLMPDSCDGGMPVWPLISIVFEYTFVPITVSTLAGGDTGSAKFVAPRDCAVWTNPRTAVRYLLVTDKDESGSVDLIRAVDLDVERSVTRFAGGGDGDRLTPSDCQLFDLRGLCVNPIDGSILTTEAAGVNTVGGRIRLLDVSSDSVRTVAGYYLGGHNDGIGLEARFNHPHGIAVASSGAFAVVCDRNNHTIRRIELDADRSHDVTTIAGCRAGRANSNGRAVGGAPNDPIVANRPADFVRPEWIAFAPRDDAADTAPAPADSLIYILAGSSVRCLNTATNQVTSVQLSRYIVPSGFAFVSSFECVTSDAQSDSVFSINVRTGQTDLLAGALEPGYADGPNAVARFDKPLGVALCDSETCFVVDSGNSAIRRVAVPAQLPLFSNM